MSKIDGLLKSYEKHISTPWRNDAAPAQRVIFCVYNEKDERALRVKLGEFEIAASRANHDWLLFDLTDTFADWLSVQKYAEKYFMQPDLLVNIYPKYLVYLTSELGRLLAVHGGNENTVLALSGVASLFGILKVKDVVENFAPMVKGRLLVFFPGSLENNNYRLLDGYDGWNYLAVPITADKDY
jgi:hypothetical protein